MQSRSVLTLKPWRLLVRKKTFSNDRPTMPVGLPGSGQSGFGGLIDAGVEPGSKYSRTRRCKTDSSWAKVQRWSSTGRRWSVMLCTTVPGGGDERERSAATMKGDRTTRVMLSMCWASTISRIDRPIVGRTLPLLHATMYNTPCCMTTQQTYQSVSQ